MQGRGSFDGGSGGAWAPQPKFWGSFFTFFFLFCQASLKSSKKWTIFCWKLKISLDYCFKFIKRVWFSECARQELSDEYPQYLFISIFSNLVFKGTIFNDFRILGGNIALQPIKTFVFPKFLLKCLPLLNSDQLEGKKLLWVTFNFLFLFTPCLPP